MLSITRTGSPSRHGNVKRLANWTRRQEEKIKKNKRRPVGDVAFNWISVSIPTDARSLEGRPQQPLNTVDIGKRTDSKEKAVDNFLLFSCRVKGNGNGNKRQFFERQRDELPQPVVSSFIRRAPTQLLYGNPYRKTEPTHFPQREFFFCLQSRSQTGKRRTLPFKARPDPTPNTVNQLTDVTRQNFIPLSFLFHLFSGLFDYFSVRSSSSILATVQRPHPALLNRWKDPSAQP